MGTHVPGRSSVVSLCCIVISFTVPTQEKKLILDVAGTLKIQAEDLVGKALPLSLHMVGIIQRIGRVTPID